MLGRRKFLGTVGATAVAVAAVRSAGGTDPDTGDTGPLAEAGLKPKARFGTCEVVSLASTPDGAVNVRLSDSSGQAFDVELLAYDAHVPGVARAGSLSVYLNNRGGGTKATVEEHGLAAMALASHLARREAAGGKLPALPTLSDRARARV
ncbi:MAG TPA: hypothetical protein VGL81_27700 [Polyangiaceae bacterium]|jgi:hypothetical protein